MGEIEAIIKKKDGKEIVIEEVETIYLLASKEYEIVYAGDLGSKKHTHDCRDCYKWLLCPNGMRGHINGTSIGFSIGECKEFDPINAE